MAASLVSISARASRRSVPSWVTVTCSAVSASSADCADLREPLAEPLAVAGAPLALGLEILTRSGELRLGLLQRGLDLADLLLRGQQLDLRADRRSPSVDRPGARGAACAGSGRGSAVAARWSGP